MGEQCRLLAVRTMIVPQSWRSGGFSQCAVPRLVAGMGFSAGFLVVTLCSHARPSNNSLQPTRLACGRLNRAWPAGLRENEWAVA